MAATNEHAPARRTLNAPARLRVAEPRATTPEIDVPGPPQEAHPPLGSSRHGYTFRRLLLASDVVALLAAIAAGSGASALAGQGPLSGSDLLLIGALLPLWLLLAHGTGLYHVAERRIDHTIVDEVGPVFMATTAWVWTVVLARAVLTSGPATLLWPAVLWLSTILLVLAVRAIARAVSAHRRWYRQSVVVIGDGDGIDRVMRRIVRHPEWGLDPIAAIRFQNAGLILDHLDETQGVRSSVPLQATNGAGSSVIPATVAAAVHSLEVGRAIVTGGSSILSERTDLIRVLARERVCVDYVSGEPETLYSSAVLHHLEGLPILSVQPTQLTRGASALKRCVDVALSGLGLVLLAPVLAYSAIRIKLDSNGPVFYRQPRVGRGGETFEILKFRTMIDDADSMRQRLRGEGIHGEHGVMLKLRRDPRVTGFGARLRRWSLDELPQLWNVLRGDMSLVGPRPLPLDEAPLVKDHFLERTRVRPGITGPWQTQGRSDIPFEDMVKLDYTYVVGWSMHEDLRLLLRTATAVLARRGAY